MSEEGGFTIIPETHQLAQNFPNPFKPSTRIRYTVPTRGFVRLSVYDLTGRVVRTLVSERELPGAHQIIWDGTNASGETVSSGVYFIRLRVGDQVFGAQKLMLAR